MAPQELNWKHVIMHGDLSSAKARVLAQLEGGVSVDCKSRYGKTLLHSAVITDDLPVAQLAISRGVPVNATVYPLGKGHRDKATLGWSALFYAVRNGSYAMANLLLESGASDLESCRGETPLQLAVRLQCQDIFWLQVLHGFRSSTHDSSNRVPATVGHCLAWSDSPRDLVTSLEAFLLESFDPGLCQPSVPSYCSSCRSLLESTDQAPRKACEERLRRIQRLTAVGDPFSYGFLRRCRICRASLVTLPERFRIGSADKGIILPSNYSGISLAQKNSREADLLHLLKLRESLPEGSYRHTLLLPAYWLVRCLKNHKECTTEEELPQLPRRVIAVGAADGSDVPRLIESETNQVGTYCTLSYRWSNNPSTLQVKNLSTLKKALPVAGLPITIQRTIRLARGLGFKYLWVDALCIIQDSDEDWEAEAAKMDSIYSRSTLTIAAVDGPDSLPDDSGLPFAASPGTAEHGWRPRGELDTRGWVAQEEILSRRILAFSKAGVYWSCAKWNCSEWQPTGIPTWRKEPGGNTVREVRTWAANPRSLVDGYKLWAAILQDYTRRQLTIESDRFAAIKGIASFFSSQLDDRIVAGMWQRNLLTDMAWYAVNSPSRPTTYPAPSWSWGSVAAPIEHIAITESHLADVEVLDVQVDESGKGYAGSITLSGVMIPVDFEYGRVSFILCPDPEYPKLFEPGIPADKHHLSFLMRGSAWRPDDARGYTGTGFALHMGGYALALVPVVDKAHTFRRVGLCLWGADLSRCLATSFKFGTLANAQTTVTLI